MTITRRLLVTAFVLSIAAAANGQPAAAPPPVSIGLPLPPIGLPLPPIGLQPRDVPEPAPRPPRPPRPGKPAPPPAIIVFGAPYDWGFEPWQHSSVPGAIPSQPETEITERVVAPPEMGRLELDVRPPHAQVFVDGEFVGTWNDLAGELELTPGTHRIEIRAPGHAALTFDARITAGRTITYQGVLKPIESEKKERSSEPRASAATPNAADTPASPRPPQTFYMIPSCYLGNVPPEQVKLAPGCEQRRVYTHTPRR